MRGHGYVPNRRGRIATAALRLGTATVVTVMSAIVVLAPLNTDAAFCLVVARRLLGGERLYVDVIETNPPLIFWMYKVPAYLNQYLGLRDDRLVGTFVAGVLVASCALAAAVLRSASRLGRPFKAAVICAFAAAVVIPFVQQVGQKEQIAVVLFFPYALAVAREIDGEPVGLPLAIATAAFAAIGIAIKPFFLAPWIALEATAAATTGRWQRRTAWIIGVAQAGYGLAVVLANDAYASRMLPMVRAWYWAYGTSWTSVITMKAVGLMALAAGAACATWSFFPETAGASDAVVFGASSIGWLVAAVSQSKGWYYHLLPALVFTTLAVEASGFVLLRSVRAPATLRRRQLGRTTAVAAILGLPVAWFAPMVVDASRQLVSTLRNPYSPSVTALTRFVAERAAGEPVYMMSTGMWPMFPVVNLSGATIPYRYHFLWPLPALYARADRSTPHGRAPERQAPLENAFFNAVVDDLVARPPRILIVDRDPFQQAMNGVVFDHLAYFGQAPQFRALIQQYRREGSAGYLEIFERR